MQLFSNLRISHKISALMLGLVFGFILIGVTYYVQINADAEIRRTEQQTFSFQNQVAQLNVKTLQMQSSGRQHLASGADSHRVRYEELLQEVTARLQSLSAQGREQGVGKQLGQLAELLKSYEALYADALETAGSTLFDSSFADPLSTVDDELSALEADISRAFADTLGATALSAERVLTQGAARTKAIQTAVTAIIFVVAMGTAVGIYLIYKSIVFPMVHIQSVIRRINKGQSQSRVKLQSADELGDLGRAFNKLFDERIQQLETQSLENERLNNSIISLIKSLGLIARKDLTVKVPVSADITGTVSDAVNLLTSETAHTLHKVRSISEDVKQVSDRLQVQSQRVVEFADSEKKQVIAASKALELLAQAMSEVARKAEETRLTADEAIANTQSARESVENTVEGIRAIRETIAETEKRTKRLGERSQEISGIVSLINTIAERTHILALNASMHAASAGEAGKGFAVVADEVQRLAENARQSTGDISAMINNMRVETADTVAIMNTLISQVADGSRKAEQAGRDMSSTEAVTRRLVDNVDYIARQAVQQADVANRVRDRSALIRSYAEKTGRQIVEQKTQTDRLRAFAQTLVERVNVFTLPAGKVEEEVLIEAEVESEDSEPENRDRLQAVV